MLSGKTLAVIFAAAVVGIPFAAGGIKHLAIDDLDNLRQSEFRTAEAYNTATERLFFREAISRDTYHQRQGYFAACTDANQQYSKVLKSRDLESIRLERRVFEQTCTMPAPKL